MRGPNNILRVDVSNSEDSGNTGVNQSLTSFNSDGFSAGQDDDIGCINYADKTYVAWGWKAGGAPSGTLAGSGATASLTNGVGNGTIHNSATGVSNATSITQSVNQNSGFSITKFTGHASGVTLPHNLGGTPDFIIMKSLGTGMWTVWHSGMSNSTESYLRLDTDLAETTYSDVWPTAPSTTLIYSGTDDSNGGTASNNHIMYAWKAVSGVSAFGTYTGGTSISKTTNFEPKLIIIKNISSVEDWVMLDAFRGFKSTSLPNPPALFPSDPTSEITGSASNYYHITTSSSGFTVGDAGDVPNGINDGSSSTNYIYMAFA